MVLHLYLQLKNVIYLFIKMIKSILPYFVAFTAVILSLISCKDDVIPKPKAHLRLDYPTPEYNFTSLNCPFGFELNTLSNLVEKKDCSFQIEYPKMKATIYLSYKPVNNDVEQLLKDAQKLTYEHVIKADDIVEQPFINPDKKVYGMFYLVGGNAATNTQFYVTDSVNNFVVGSAYFYTKPNFDSILPAVNYIKNDMRVIMESFEWK